MKKFTRLMTLLLVLAMLVTVAGAKETNQAILVEALDLAVTLPNTVLVYDRSSLTEEFPALTAAMEENQIYLQFVNKDYEKTGKVFAGAIGLQHEDASDFEPIIDFSNRFEELTKKEDLLTEKIYEKIYRTLGLKGVDVDLDDYETEQTVYQKAQVKYRLHGKQVVFTTYTAEYDGQTYVFAFVTVGMTQTRTIETIMKSVVLNQSTYSATGFADMKGHWAEASVLAAVDKGLFSGTTATTFSPDAPMTRAMLVQVLYRMAGEPKAEPAEFADVAADDWFAKAVAWAAENGIVQGADNKFDPDGILTREQLAAILWRYAKYNKRDVSVGENTNILSYNDAFDIAEYAIPAFQWTCGAGLMQGMEDGYLAPQGTTTRAQVAAVLVRYLEK